MGEGDGVEWLLKLLRDVQLEQFFTRLRDDLQITRLSHFDFVKPEDLERIGLGMCIPGWKLIEADDVFVGKPGVRRLIEAVKKRRAHERRKSLINKINPLAEKSEKKKEKPSIVQDLVQHSVSCLIQEKDLT